MDIDILLWFQEIRNLLGTAGELAVHYLSDLLIVSALIVPFVLYWCRDKEEGRDLLLALGISMYLNQFLKVTFSVYRPWIRDARIQPSAHAKASATGYSFPSAHTELTSTVYGGIAIRHKDNRKIVRLCVLLYLVTGLSRLLLGVHTPQDVLVALLVSMFSLAAAGRVDRFMEQSERNRWIVSGITVVLTLAGILYALLKQYPMDYNNGVLIVDPESMIVDAMLCISVYAGLVIGSVLEQKYLTFSTEGTPAEKTIRFIVGALGIGVCVIIHKILRISGVPVWVWGLVRGLSASMFAMYLYPLLFTKVHAMLERRKNTAK